MSNYIPLDALASRFNLQGRFEGVRSQSLTGRFANLKPISDFFDVKRISKPQNFGEVQNRVNYNLGYFASNYAVLFVMLSIYTLITNLLLTFVILFVIGGMFAIGKLQGRDVEIGSFRATTSQLYTGLVVIAVPLAIIANPFSAALWLIGASGVSIMGHAAFMEKPIEPPGALAEGDGAAWRHDFEARRARFQDLDGQADDASRAYLDPAGYKSRSTPRLDQGAFASDELFFTGYDLRDARDGRRPRDQPYDDPAYRGGPYRSREEQAYYEGQQRIAPYRTSREEALVQSASNKLRKARTKGKTTVSLSVEEMAALEGRSGTREPAEPRTPSKAKTRASRSSSNTSLASTKQRKTSNSLFAAPSPTHSRSRTPKTSRKSSSEQQPQAYAPSSTPPAFLVRGPDGAPFYAPADFYPSPDSPRSARQDTPAYEAYPGHLYAARPEMRAYSSSDFDDLPRSRSASGAPYPDVFAATSSPAAQARRVPSGSSDVAYASLRRVPQSSPLSSVDPRLDDPREWGARAGAGRKSSSRSSSSRRSSSSDDSGEGVRVEVDTFGSGRVRPESRGGGTTVRRKGRR